MRAWVRYEEALPGLGDRFEAEVRTRPNDDQEAVRPVKLIEVLHKDYLAGERRYRLTNHMIGWVDAGDGFDGWLFPGEPRRRR